MIFSSKIQLTRYIKIITFRHNYDQKQPTTKIFLQNSNKYKIPKFSQPKFKNWNSRFWKNTKRMAKVELCNSKNVNKGLSLVDDFWWANGLRVMQWALREVVEPTGWNGTKKIFSTKGKLTWKNKNKAQPFFQKGGRSVKKCCHFFME